MRNIFFILLFCISNLFLAHSVGNVGPGIPQKDKRINLYESFITPPSGYGEVPFYWWLGDTLTREHLKWHLDLLENKSITSLQINYAHSDKGGPFWGLTYPSKPDLFTEDWWNLFNWFKEEANKRNMTVSLSDYTLGVGQGSYVDKALESYPELISRELKFDKIVCEGHVSLPVKENVLSVIAYLNGKSIDLTSKINNKHIETELPSGKWEIYICRWAKRNISFDAMNPVSGKAYIDNFFQKFVDKAPQKDSKGLNFFFSDELNFNNGRFPWNDIFSYEFKKRKGYNIEKYLPALICDIGDMTMKVRLDYNDVYVSLCEENYFKPVYDWHQKRGMIIGCDHGGRGRDVAEFGDYFRTQRWNQGPGSDQPRLGKDIIKAKVASSIAHLYKRPRVWLEGFYSSGWGTSTEKLLDAIYSNFLMGYNLLSFHGLYYSTPGGWWEWAPPCNHFRMPYWEQMGDLLKMTERISFLFSQGYHVADVAILYPVEPVIAGFGNRAPEMAFDAASTLYSKSIDFDFIDYESLFKASIKDQCLKVSGENYKMIIIPEMKAIKYSSLEKLVKFKKAGGKIVILGNPPVVTDRYVRGDEKVENMINELLSPASNLYCINQVDDSLIDIFDDNFVRDFKIMSDISYKNYPYFMHRSINDYELYSMYGVPYGSKCFIRTKGSVELWNPWNSDVIKLKVKEVTDEGMFFDYPVDANELCILMVNRNIDPIVTETETQKTNYEIVTVDENWNFELRPVLDNRYGDFLWPATNEIIGANVYSAMHAMMPGSGNQDWILPSFNDSEWKRQSFSYGKRFYIIDGTDSIPDNVILDNLPSLNNSSMNSFGHYRNRKTWVPYEFSWRWGVESDYGHQGYHGLKMEISDEFIRLGNISGGLPELKRTAKQKNNYYLYTKLKVDKPGKYKVETGKIRPSGVIVNGKRQNLDDGNIELAKGVNDIILHYNRHGITHFVVKNNDYKTDIPEYYQKELPLKMSFRGDKSIIPFDLYSDNSNMYNCFRFKSAPGLNKISFNCYGQPRVWVNGKECVVNVKPIDNDGLMSCEATVENVSSAEAIVALQIRNISGMNGGAAIDDCIKQYCSEGTLSKLEDLSKIDGLRHYSGSMWYRKNIYISSLGKYKKTYIDLGKVVSTAEVYVNGKKVGLKFKSPWRFDISDYIKDGNNLIEILVHNTAANHYLHIPTSYRGNIESGIIGPVSLIKTY